MRYAAAITLTLVAGCSSASETTQHQAARDLVAAWCAENVEHPDAGLVSIELGEGTIDDRHCLATLRLPDPATPGAWTFATFEFRLDLRPSAPKVIDVGFDSRIMEASRRQLDETMRQAERTRRAVEILKEADAARDLPAAP